MLDILKYYSCLDVQSLHEMVQKKIEFYKTEKIDFLKEILPVSGAANNIFHPFSQVKANFGFEANLKDFKCLKNLVRRQIFGGPCEVFSRY